MSESPKVGPRAQEQQTRITLERVYQADVDFFSDVEPYDMATVVKGQS